MIREELKRACLGILDSMCIEHPAGHQSKLAARYVIVARNGERIGLMFEKAPSAPANLWLRADHARRLGNPGCDCRDYPASDLYAENDEKGRPIYGRHAGLKTMRDLAHADLLRLAIEDVGQLEHILFTLKKSD
ncbi:hypothetical protein [Tabrizicola sp.]|uniref:hypothetical protein n=1 Tax=Tabrizicola sp. TaxID=2005166 RepID=UPI0035B16F58